MNRVEKIRVQCTFNLEDCCVYKWHASSQWIRGKSRCVHNMGLGLDLYSNSTSENASGLDWIREHLIEMDWERTRPDWTRHIAKCERKRLWAGNELFLWWDISVRSMFCNVLTKMINLHIAFMPKVQSQVSLMWTQPVSPMPVQALSESMQSPSARRTRTELWV